MSELVYVSWGGTGHAVTLREALKKADQTNRSLVYLAILDEATFSDLDPAMALLAEGELDWLLAAQMELIRSRLGVGDLNIRVLIRHGDVATQVVDVVSAIGDAEILIGAPVLLNSGIDTLIDVLTQQTGVPVSVIGADLVSIDNGDDVAAAD